MKTQYTQNDCYYQAQLRVRKLTRFYGHLFVYMIVLMLYVLKNYFGAPLNFFPIHFLNDFVMSIWTFVIAVKLVKLFFAEIIFDGRWEQNKIDKIMSQNSENHKWK
jgi:hypothetical protein